jgi:molybdopterin converting factor small subunit
MTIHIVAYGVLREVFGARTFEVTLPASARTVADALDVLTTTNPAFAPHRASTAVAVNAALVPAITAISAGMTLDLLPPVSGG